MNLGSEEWKELSKIQVFLADESHLTASDTLEKVCSGLCGNAPYRFFISATQMRNDGSDLLLKGIIGPIKLTMTSVEAIDAKWLARPNFIVNTSYSPSRAFYKDSLKMISTHLYNNPYVHEQAAKIANNVIEKLGHKVLIAIDHVDQFKYLYPHLRYELGFAHGPLNKKNKESIPSNYHKSDPGKLVEEFNQGKLKLLVGTSTISIRNRYTSINTYY